MMSVCKWTSFAWCYTDGGKDESKLSKDQKLRRITNLPNFFEYFSFMSFFGSAVVGPHFDYYEFNIFIKNQDLYSKIPFTLLNSLTWLAEGVFFSIFAVFILVKFPLTYVITDEYNTRSYLW